MSGVRRLASVSPMSSGAMAEWFPTFGASWQVVQVPTISGVFRSSFSPPTPAIRIRRVLNNVTRATARRRGLAQLRQALNSVGHGAGVEGGAEGIVPQRVNLIPPGSPRPRKLLRTPARACGLHAPHSCHRCLGGMQPHLELHDLVCLLGGQVVKPLGVPQRGVVRGQQRRVEVEGERWIAHRRVQLGLPAVPHHGANEAQIGGGQRTAEQGKLARAGIASRTGPGLSPGRTPRWRGSAVPAGSTPSGGACCKRKPGHGAWKRLRAGKRNRRSGENGSRPRVARNSFRIRGGVMLNPADGWDALWQLALFKDKPPTDASYLGRGDEFAFKAKELQDALVEAARKDLGLW